jgi:hypothetical protein
MQLQEEVVGMRSNLIATLVSVVGIIAVSPMGAVAVASEPESIISARGVHVLGGLTSQGFPVLMEVARNGRQVKRAVAGIGLRCSAGGRFADSDSWTRIPVNRRGSFKATYRDSFMSEGDQVTISDSVEGKVNAKRTGVTGHWRNIMVVREPNGTVDTCDSGSVRFSARR